jgi:MFS family permease
MPDKLRAVFRHGAFARYMAGEAVSMTGTWMQVMAQSWVMTSLTASAAMFGLVNFAAGIPMLVLSLLGGLVADRFDRRHILLTTQVAQIALALLLGWLVAVERVAVWHILAVAFALGVSNAFEWPAAAALVPELASREHVATAIAIDRSVFHGTRLIGPALAGYVIGLWGSAAAFFLNALSFVPFILALVSLQPRAQGSAEEQAQRRTGMKAGVAYVRSDKPTLGMIALMAATTAFVFPVVVVMMPLYATKVLGLGPDKMGLLMAISSIGSLSGSASLLAVPADKRRGLMLAAVIGVAAALTSLSQARAFAVAAASQVVSSLGTSTLLGLANTVVQERAPGPLRGRVSAVAGLSFFGLMPFASLGLTSVADWIGMRVTLRVAAALYLITGVGVLWRLRGVKREA